MFSSSDILKKNIANLPGWRTNRKIVVFESDDWGSVRIRDKHAYDVLKENGLNVDRYHYDSVESLESNEDFELLFNLLTKFKDINGRSPMFTAMCILGNPDFEKIKESGYKHYHFQPLKKTMEEYPNSSKLLDYWIKGKSSNLFIPELHGREHVNVRRYMKILQSHEGKEGMRLALDFKSIGPSAFKNFIYPNYLGALHPSERSEITELHNYVLEAGKLFKEYIGAEPSVFIAPNAEEPKELEYSLNKVGVKFLTRSKRRLYPIGDGNFRKELCVLGSKNKFGQTYLNRNAFFEPVAWGEHEHISDWVESCLFEIGLAFRWNKPAIISTHRVNYVGSISSSNRYKGLDALEMLIKRMLGKWPQIEFMSSSELGKHIENSRK